MGLRSPHAILGQRARQRRQEVRCCLHGRVHEHDESTQALLEQDVLGCGLAQNVVGVDHSDPRVSSAAFSSSHADVPSVEPLSTTTTSSGCLSPRESTLSMHRCTSPR